MRLQEAEYERKLKLQEERILFRQSKSEEREVYEVRRQAQIERELLQKQLEDAKEEIDYFQKKVAKIEAENKGLRLNSDNHKRQRELEEEFERLKAQVQSQ